MKMNWDKLICDKRLGLEDCHSPQEGSRSDFRRDFDRLVFSSPFRRLQNKTQVFPLPGSVFVHNRLTHSIEVASVGRSIAGDVTLALKKRYAGEPWVEKLDALDEIVAAACLAHDLGNPPFGHSGEKAISAFFSEGEGSAVRDSITPAQWSDLTHFEGNANSFRVLTHQFNGRRPGGFAMTYSMLSSIVKYPYASTAAGARCKFGFFESEADTFSKIAGELGILSRKEPDGSVSYARHPLVYIVEAADDICYQVMDIEDAHKLRVLSTAEVIEIFLAFFDEDRQSRMYRAMERVSDPNEKIAYLRSCVIGTLVKESVKAFVDNEEEILAGEFRGTLIDHISPRVREAYSRCSAKAWAKIYCASDVVDIELAGNRIISFLLEKLVNAVRFPELNYSQLLLSQVPEQYEIKSPTLYGRVQAVLDHVSAMTDVYALELYRKLNGMSLPAV